MGSPLGRSPSTSLRLTAVPGTVHWQCPGRRRARPGEFTEPGPQPGSELFFSHPSEPVGYEVTGYSVALRLAASTCGCRPGPGPSPGPRRASVCRRWCCLALFAGPAARHRWGVALRLRRPRQALPGSGPTARRAPDAGPRSESRPCLSNFFE